MIRTILTLAMVASSGLATAQTEVPNDFQAGTPARAAEVNANFDTVETAIDQNIASIADNANDIATNTGNIAANTAGLSNSTAIRWLANDQVVGSFIQLDVLLSFEDYVVIFDSPNGRIWPVLNGYLYYLELDCQGQAYINQIDLPGILAIGDGGAVVGSPFNGDPVRLYSWDSGSTLIENQTFLSNLSEANAGCSNGDSVGVDAYPVYPNDPAVTGVSSEFFDLPMTIGHR